MYQLDYRVATATGAWSSVLTSDTQKVVEGLIPGTKYSFRARGGYGTQQVVSQALSGSGSSNGGDPSDVLTWGEFSVESSYVTSGTAGSTLHGLLCCW